MNAQNNISRIRNAYSPEQQDTAVGADGQPVLVTWAEYALLEIVSEQQAEIDALKAQVAQLVETTPSASAVEEYHVIDTYGGNAVVGRFPEEHLAKTFAATQDGFVVVNAPSWPGWGEVLGQRYAPGAGVVEERGQC